MNQPVELFLDLRLMLVASIKSNRSRAEPSRRRFSDVLVLRVSPAVRVRRRQRQ